MASSRSKQPKQRRFVTPTMSLHQHVGNDLPPRPHSFIATSKLPRSLGVSNVKSHCVTPDYRSQSLNSLTPISPSIISWSSFIGRRNRSNLLVAVTTSFFDADALVNGVHDAVGTPIRPPTPIEQEIHTPYGRQTKSSTCRRSR
jgi:hypothetical protein